MANNTINHLLRLSVCVLAIAGLAGCGGGGGEGGNPGGDPGGNETAGLQCHRPRAVDQPLQTYGFWFPGVDPKTGEITLINADNLADQSAPISALRGSVAVAQGGEYRPPADGQTAIVRNFRPLTLVYIDKQGDVARIQLGADESRSPQPLTVGAGISQICRSSIVAINFNDDKAVPDYYYLYSVPGDDGKCDIVSAKDPAYSVRLGESALEQGPGTPVDNVTPVGTLADIDTGHLRTIIAVDESGNLNIYDDQYNVVRKQVFSDVSTARDLYHTVDTEFVEIKSSNEPYTIVRFVANEVGQPEVAAVPLTNTTKPVSASYADSVFFYYALRTDSGYAIYRMRLDGSSTPEKLYSVDGHNAFVSSLRITGDHLIYHARVNGETTGTVSTGTLYSIPKNGRTDNGAALRLDKSVLTDPHFIAANNHVYYSVVVDDAGNTQAKENTPEGNAISGPYKQSRWLNAVLPANRPSGVATPEYVLLAAGYTGSPPSLYGMALDSVPTNPDTSPMDPCVLMQVFAYPGVDFDPNLRFASLGIGYVYDSSGHEVRQFAFDAADGRFSEFPK